MFRIFVVCLLAAFSLGSEIEDRFEEWIGQFEIKIENFSHREHVFTNWLENDVYIQQVNDKNLSYSLGHNHLSGLTQDEYRVYMGLSRDHEHHFEKHDGSKLREVKCLYDCVKDYDAEHKLVTLECVDSCLSPSLGTSLPDSVDWVKKGAVTPVKDQGQCGSCWSFSTTGALEGAYYIKNKDLVSFSEQELVDCDNMKNGGRDHGCNGGLMDNAFNWIEKNGGLCTEESYPYQSGTTRSPGTCEKSCESVEGSKITSFHDVAKNSDDAMMSALSEQPVSIAIQADQKDFQLYKSGVFSGDCGTKLDHGVLVVGYGSDGENDYYLVKNSWSTSWGDKGYIKLGRGSQYNNGSGQCGLLMQGSYPIVE
tara:strand:- start:3095 stop:4192 length:1098 start_codon:yes stop_codon:yes gene_type:complete